MAGSDVHLEMDETGEGSFGDHQDVQGKNFVNNAIVSPDHSPEEAPRFVGTAPLENGFKILLRRLGIACSEKTQTSCVNAEKGYGVSEDKAHSAQKRSIPSENDGKFHGLEPFLGFYSRETQYGGFVRWGKKTNGSPRSPTP